MQVTKCYQVFVQKLAPNVNIFIQINSPFVPDENKLSSVTFYNLPYCFDLHYTGLLR